MQQLRGFALLAIFSLLNSACIVCAQTSDSGKLRTSIARPATSDDQTSADSAPGPPVFTPIAPNAPRMERRTRYEIIHDFETLLVYSRTNFPMGTKGLILKDGVISPNGEEMQQTLNLWGPSIKPGDPAHISYIQIKPDHIHFEINGGPVHRQKWYQRIEISGGDGPVTTSPDNPQTNPHGSYLDLYFDKYVPEMTAAQLRGILYPVLDFAAHNKEQAYLDSLPPKVSEAIQQHRVLVGMNQEMVLHAMGKPPKKDREQAGDTMYEEWIYGEMPADVNFVRFVGDEVVRVETMKVDGEKIVRTQKEVFLDQDKNKEAKKQEEDRPATAPSLRRPGEDQDNVPKPANGAAPPPNIPPPDLPQPGGPGGIVATR
jgi:hypothetical protein